MSNGKGARGMIRPSRLPFTLLAFASLLIGLWSGLHQISGILTTIAILGYFATLGTITITRYRRHAQTL